MITIVLCVVIVIVLVVIIWIIAQQHPSDLRKGLKGSLQQTHGNSRV